MQNNILLVGCGKMGSALLSGFTKKLAKQQIYVVEKDINQAKKINKAFGVNIVSSLQQLQNFVNGVIIFAVKPQIIPDIIAEYKSLAINNLIISIVAGKPVSFFTEKLGNNTAIIRTMPNLPATLGKGMTVAFANKNVSDKQKKLTEDFFTLIGNFLWLNDEARIDDATAISGSGPAYMFYFIECFIKAAIELGFDAKTAKELVMTTIDGSIALALNDKASVTALREAVTSAKGTTEAGLDIFMKDSDRLENLLINTVKATKQRARELAG